MTMMSKLTAQDNEQINNLSLTYNKAREEHRQEIFMINIIMTKEINIDMDLIVEIGEFH